MPEMNPLKLVKFLGAISLDLVVHVNPPHRNSNHNYLENSSIV